MNEVNLPKWSQHAYVDMVSEEDLLKVLEHVDMNGQLGVPKSEAVLTVKRCVNKQETFLPKLEAAVSVDRKPAMMYTKAELLAIREACKGLSPPSIFEDLRHLLKSQLKISNCS
uniref:Uncharacterized protein n=1 Tax=Acrobeloides nanus TaxID=290746 RepID=A0A914DRT7_9BILA